MADISSHVWRFFRAGGFYQVKIESGADLVHLDELDQKLWVALACPIAGLDFDPVTAALIDTDGDGRIRAPELIAAAKWAGAMLKDPDLLITGGDTLALAAIDDATEDGQALLGAARHILNGVSRPEGDALTLAEAAQSKALFAAAALNGDGIVPPEAVEDPALAAAVKDIMACAGAVTDASGQPGVSQELTDQFFAECAAFDEWNRLAEGPEAASILPAREGTEAAAAAVHAIRAKVDDYFARCRLAEFDARLTPALNRKEEDYAALAAQTLSLSAAEAADFPLARIAPDQPLHLDGPINPAHAAALAALRADAIRPLIGARAELREGDWVTLLGKLDAYEKWQAAKKGASVEKLGLARVRELLTQGFQEKINALIAQDKQLENEAAAVGNLERLIRYTRDLRHLCRNFVSFQELYLETTTAIFLVGTLYLDRRACFLCLTVADPGRHAAMAGLSGAYLAYCDCVRKGSNEKLSIVAIVSEGDDDNLMVGRNGIFYDRQGRDFDATITKIVSSPISLRQAFWSPYKKLGRVVEEYVASKASAAQNTVNAEMSSAATGIAAGSTPPAPAPAPAAAGKKFDPSVVALFSVALGSLAAAFAAVMTFLGKFPKSQLPLVLLGIMLLISLPSVILAYIKLRKRSLGPILDANGWAINAKASINVPFGARLTEMARLPSNAAVDKRDLYRQRATLWPKILAAAFFLWWAYAILDDCGVVYRLTRDWKYGPLGSPPANVQQEQERQREQREREQTNAAPHAANPPATNAPAK